MPSNTSILLVGEKPKTEQALLERCSAIRGQTLLALATACDRHIPHSLHHAKGFVGQLLEYCLGADGTNEAQPDFAHLGIELKTIPLNVNHHPKESTYVCTAPMNVGRPETWMTSRVRHKLAKVLWVPIEAAPAIPIAKRKIGTPLLWSLPPELEAILKQDWEELTEMLQCGEIAHLSAKQGVYLQIRPKAAHSRVLMPTFNAQDEAIFVNPKGFYLRTAFTKKILQAYSIENSI